MITQINLKAYKSFVDETLALNKLTILTGLNSSGKSSVIQAIRMMNRLRKKTNFLLPGYGDIKEITNDSSAQGTMCIKIKNDEGNEFLLKEGASELGKDSHFPKLIHIAAGRFGPRVNIMSYDTWHDMEETGENVLTCIDSLGEIHVPKCLVPDDAQTDLFPHVLKEWMKIISPSVDFEYYINHKADISYSTFNQHRAKNVGFGLSYTLPCIVALLQGAVTPNSLVIIENPEAHLHAKAQYDMAELIGKCVEAGAQVIIETHSDHLFDGLRAYTKQHTGFNEMMNCYWLELTEGNTKATLIRLHENGRYKNADLPENFMDQFRINMPKQP